jgi:hypothetical protein
MIEINISDWEFRAGATKARTEDLATVVEKAEKELKSRTAAEIKDAAVYSKLINTILGVYYSLETKLTLSSFFDFAGKDKNRVIRHYSLYNASKAAMAILYDSKIAGLYSLDNPPATDFDDSTMNDKSSFSLLKSVLKKMEDKLASHGCMKYNLFQYFDNIKNYCKLNLFTLIPEDQLDKLNNIKVTKEGIDFNEIFKQKAKAEDSGVKTAKGELDKYVPDEMPEYSNAEIDYHDCIGNVEQIEQILISVFMSLRYDPVTQKNDFSKIGFNNNFLIYGKEGVGKTMAVDSIVTWAKKTAENIGKPLYVTDMTPAFKTPLVDMSGKILEEFFNRQEKGDMVYINVFDENGGGKFGNANKPGSNKEDSKFLETAKKVIGKKYKGNVINLLITNYTDDESIESAFKQRFGEKIQLEGPKTAEQFAKVLEYHLKGLNTIGVIDPNTDLVKIGDIFAQYKQLEKPGFAVTGRSVEMVSYKLNKCNPKILQHTELLRNQNVPVKQLFTEYKKMLSKYTADKLREIVVDYLKSELSCDYRIDRPAIKVTEMEVVEQP